MWFRRKPKFSRFKAIMSALTDLQNSSKTLVAQGDVTVALIATLRGAIGAAADDSEALIAVKAELDRVTAKLAGA